MRRFSFQRVAAAILILAALVSLALLWRHRSSEQAAQEEQRAREVSRAPRDEVLGASVEGRDIVSRTYGSGATRLVFVGGIHGGYEWNSVVLAYQVMDYLDQNPDAVPPGLSVTIIPNLNPDAVFKVTGKEGRFASSDVTHDTATLESARFNARGVDLNRNFDCKWQPTGVWRNRTVSAGTAAFSEPEAKTLERFILRTKPAVAVFWHSQAKAVYASQCEEGILPGTRAAMNAYAKAAGYPAVAMFDAYETTGASDDWLASIGIPAITVELSTHDSIEWSKNIAGIKALILLYSDTEAQ